MTTTYWLIVLSVASVLTVYFGVNKLKGLSLFKRARESKYGDLVPLLLSIFLGLVTTIPGYIALGFSAWIGLSVALGHSFSASLLFVVLKKVLKSRFNVDLDEVTKEEGTTDGVDKVEPK